MTNAVSARVVVAWAGGGDSGARVCGGTPSEASHQCEASSASVVGGTTRRDLNALLECGAPSVSSSAADAYSAIIMVVGAFCGDYGT